MERPETDKFEKVILVKVHLGCGRCHIAGYYHVDIAPFPHVDRVAPIDRLPWLDDDCADLIYASHVLEHFSRSEIHSVLREWWRVLKPGGLLRLAVPDFSACAKLYYEQGLVDGLTGLIGLISGGQRDRFDFHKMIFDADLLTKLLIEAGFTAVRHWDWRATEHAHIDDFSQAYLPHMDKENGLLMSLNMEAIK